MILIVDNGVYLMREKKFDLGYCLFFVWVRYIGVLNIGVLKFGCDFRWKK